MIMNVTREVITDLWPLYAAGEAHADTRALVDAFLKQDPKFAQVLEGRGVETLLAENPPGSSFDREARALLRTKRLLQGTHWLLVLQLGAIMFTCQAFGRIVADTSWDVSPRNFIIMLSIAVVLWIAYLASSYWVRRRVYRQTMADQGLSA
jgi:hypothetical protein